MDVISVCDKTDIWAIGVLFLDMVTKNRLSNTFKTMHQSFISQDIASGKMILEFAKLKEMERDKLFEFIGVAHMQAEDIQKEEKLADLYKLIIGMIERKPSERSSAVNLLKLLVFKEEKAVIIKEEKDATATSTATTTDVKTV